MKKISFIAALSFVFAVSSAQSVTPSSIEDSVLGWMKVYHFKGIKEPMKVDDKFYSAAQLSICDSFANWMQASYTPKGGLGDIKKFVSKKLGDYNQNTAALPQTYGASALTYVFLRYNSKKKLEPENNLNVFWGIVANGVPGWEIADLSTPTQYYFTMPSFESSSGADDTKKYHDLSNSPHLKPYINFWIKDIEAGGGTNYVLLCKGNRSPFVKLTKREYFQQLEAAIPRFQEEEKRKILEHNNGNQKNIEYFEKALSEKILRFTTGLKKNREKYKNRLDELALTSAQPSLYDLETERDVFSNGYLSDVESTSGRVPVYKVDPGMAEQCKKDQPQWVLVNWWWSPNDPVEKYMHESIINNFDFDYVYNFFFDPAKTKGRTYKPLRSPDFTETVVTSDASDAAKRNASDRNIHFFEDFSTTAVGKKPIGWHNTLGADGSNSVVTKLDGLEGNWAIMKDYVLTPTLLKKPLPQNFTISYELVAAQNFTWGAKGLTFQLSKETSPGNAESFLRIKLRPGFDGRAGQATIESQFTSPPGYMTGSNWVDAPGFSNNKKINRITVTIKKAGELLQVFIDKVRVAEYEKAIPSALLFDAMSFYVNGNSADNDKFFLSNIKIVKD